ncbi:PT domain-containing protein [Nonomuraea fuscirosea]
MASWCPCSRTWSSAACWQRGRPSRRASRACRPGRRCSSAPGSSAWRWRWSSACRSTCAIDGRGPSPAGPPTEQPTEQPTGLPAGHPTEQPTGQPSGRGRAPVPGGSWCRPRRSPCCGPTGPRAEPPASTRRRRGRRAPTPGSSSPTARCARCAASGACGR